LADLFTSVPFSMSIRLNIRTFLSNYTSHTMINQVTGRKSTLQRL